MKEEEKSSRNKICLVILCFYFGSVELHGEHIVVRKLTNVAIPQLWPQSSFGRHLLDLCAPVCVVRHILDSNMSHFVISRHVYRIAGSVNAYNNKRSVFFLTIRYIGLCQNITAIVLVLTQICLLIAIVVIVQEIFLHQIIQFSLMPTNICCI